MPPPELLTARLGDGTTEGMLVGPEGRVLALSASPRPELLTPPSALLPLVTGLRGPVHRLLVHGDTVHEIDAYPTARGVVVLHREVPPPAGLTVREMQVLAAVAGGASNAGIGAGLGVGARTVGTHVEHVLAKTGCRTRAEAAARAATWGLLV